MCESGEGRNPSPLPFSLPEIADQERLVRVTVGMREPPLRRTTVLDADEPASREANPGANGVLGHHKALNADTARRTTHDPELTREIIGELVRADERCRSADPGPVADHIEGLGSQVRNAGGELELELETRLHLGGDLHHPFDGLDFRKPDLRVDAEAKIELARLRSNLLTTRLRGRVVLRLWHDVGHGHVLSRRVVVRLLLRVVAECHTAGADHPLDLGDVGPDDSHLLVEGLRLAQKLLAEFPDLVVHFLVRGVTLIGLVLRHGIHAHLFDDPDDRLLARLRQDDLGPVGSDDLGADLTGRRHHLEDANGPSVLAILAITTLRTGGAILAILAVLAIPAVAPLRTDGTIAAVLAILPVLAVVGDEVHLEIGAVLVGCAVLATLHGRANTLTNGLEPLGLAGHVGPARVDRCALGGHGLGGNHHENEHRHEQGQRTHELPPRTGISEAERQKTVTVPSHHGLVTGYFFCFPKR